MDTSASSDNNKVIQETLVKMVRGLVTQVLQNNAQTTSEIYQVCAHHLESELEIRSANLKALQQSRLQVKKIKAQQQMASWLELKPIDADLVTQLTPGVSSGMQSKDGTLPLRSQMNAQPQGNAMPVSAAKLQMNHLEDHPRLTRSLDDSNKDAKDCSLQFTIKGHTAPVTAIKIISSHIITASLDTTIKVWSQSTGKFLLELSCGKAVYCLQVLTVDPYRLLILPGCDDGRVPTWNLILQPKLKANCTNLLAWHSPNPIRTMAVSSDGMNIATGCCFYMHEINRNGTHKRSTRGTVKVWNLKKVIESAIAPDKHMHDVGCLALKTMRQLVAPFDVRKISAIYHTVETPTSKENSPHQNLGIRAIQYSPDDSKLMIGFGEPIDKTGEFSELGTKLMVLCCAKTLDSLWVIDHPTNQINGFQFIAPSKISQKKGTPDQLSVMISSQRALAQVLFVHLGRPSLNNRYEMQRNWIHKFEEPHYGLWATGDRDQVASAVGKVLRVWNIRTGAVLAACEGHEDCVISADFSEDGLIIATGSLDCTVRVWRNPLVEKCVLQMENELFFS